MQPEPRIGVVVATFGDIDEWGPQAEHALETAQAQIPPPYVALWEHGENLAAARNAGLALVAGACSHVLFLDADDELEEGYIDAMKVSILNNMRRSDCRWYIHRPSTRGLYEDGSIEDPPSMIPERDLAVANYIVIGAMVDADLLLRLGGFHHLPVLEDWDAYQRLVLAGAEVVEVPDAVYRITVRTGSRNAPGPIHGQTYRMIRQRHRAAWAALRSPG